MTTTTSHNSYENPLNTRYSTPEMSYCFSDAKKFSTWRKLWIALAEGEQELGLKQVTTEQIEEMKQHVELTAEEFTKAELNEKKLRHDVMAHVHTFGETCPTASKIIHLGATSCYVGDNTDLIQMKEGMLILQKKLLKVIELLCKFAEQYKSLPCLGFTHCQAAQLVTVGKRAVMWAQDFVLDFAKLRTEYETLPFRGVKGTTGTQASFLELFEGDHAKVRALDQLVTKKMGFAKSIKVSGQTYTRKLDYQVLSVLSQIAQSANKMAVDIRLLMSMKELEEPFEKNQIGSSAMAYKKNPMRSERICSLARFVMNLPTNAAETHANQWFERTLDDSANRRLSIPQAFLAVDGILNICTNVVNGIVVWKHVIAKNVMSELPFMATENILMAAVKAGGDRQALHEVIRVHSFEAARRVKEEGADNDLLDRIKKDDTFKVVHDKLDKVLDPSLYIGRSPQIVEEFIAEEVTPLLTQYAELIPKDSGTLKV